MRALSFAHCYHATGFSVLVTHMSASGSAPAIPLVPHLSWTEQVFLRCVSTSVTYAPLFPNFFFEPLPRVSPDGMALYRSFVQTIFQVLDTPLPRSSEYKRYFRTQQIQLNYRAGLFDSSQGTIFGGTPEWKYLAENGRSLACIQFRSQLLIARLHGLILMCNHSVPPAISPPSTIDLVIVRRSCTLYMMFFHSYGIIK